MYSIRLKKSFSLIELILVVLIISITYFLIFSTENFNTTDTKKNISIQNIKKHLLYEVPYKDKIEVFCIDDSFECYLKVDSNFDFEEKLPRLFDKKPDIYKYNAYEEKLTFDSIKINEVENEVVFYLKIDKDKKSNEFILDVLDKKVYVFNSVFIKTQEFNYLSEVYELFNEKIIEVKDAF